MGGGIDLDDLTEDDLNKPLSILARDLTRKRRRKMRHATMMVLRPNALRKKSRRKKDKLKKRR